MAKGEDLLGAEGFARTIAKALRADASNLARLRSILTRIAAFEGKPPDPERLQALVEGTLAIYARHMVSLFTLDAAHAKAWAKRTEFVLRGDLQRALDRKRGVILAGPHFGNMAAAMAALSSEGVPLHALFVSAGPYRWMADLGIKVIDLGDSAAACVRALNDNQVVLLFADIDFFPGGRTADFFGAPVRPPHGPARLALATGATILPFYPLETSGGRRLTCDREIRPEDLEQEAIENSLLRSMEARIAERPEHWVLMRDIWNLEEIDKSNQRQLALSARLRRWGLF
jgi:phosphatidylinositol dimannoside acyltransferase